MKKIIYQCYFLLYAWISLSQLITVAYPKSNASVFYRTMIAFDPSMTFPYTWAILAAALAVISLWPLYASINNLPHVAARLFKIILALRIISDTFGHTYEVLQFRSIALTSPVTAVIGLLITAALIFPSYKTLYDHAFLK